MSTITQEYPFQNNRTLTLPVTLVGLYFNGWIIILFLATNIRMLHWFLFPTFICGALISRDALLWLKGEYDLFDPKGILGALGWHLFFLAPLFFVHWDVGMKYVSNPPDWRPWVGLLSSLNVCGLILYHWFHRMGYQRKPVRPVYWRIKNNTKIMIWGCGFLGFALLAQAYYFTRTGGLRGILDVLSIRKQTGISFVSNVGVFEIIGNSIPIILIILITIYRDTRRMRRSPLPVILTIICGLGLLQFLFGGLRGSRSATVWSLFWIAGSVHYFWRPFSRRFVLATLAALVLFLYIYGFYKGSSKIHGATAINMIIEGTAINEMEEITGRSFKEMVVADFARVDTQSFELYRLTGNHDYQLRWGKTYLSSFLSFIPGWIWSGRPLEPEKVAAGTDLFYGQGSYTPGDKYRNSQKVYGLGGEALLNFGLLAFPVPFAFWGFLIGRYRRCMLTWRSGDFRWYLAPFLSLLFIISLIGDFYNLLGFFISKGVIPLTFLGLAFLITGQRKALEAVDANQE